MYQAIKWSLQHEDETFLDVVYNDEWRYTFCSNQFPCLLLDTEEEATNFLLDVPSEAGIYKVVKLHLTAFKAL